MQSTTHIFQTVCTNEVQISIQPLWMYLEIRKGYTTCTKVTEYMQTFECLQVSMQVCTPAEYVKALEGLEDVCLCEEV